MVSRLVASYFVLVVVADVAFAQSSTTASVSRPTPQDLERAFTRHDTVELERLGSRLGAVRLCALAEHGTPAARRAALGALELVAESLSFLPRLVAIADTAETDQAISLAAVESARHIAERVPRGEVDLDELPVDLPRASVDALMRLASREDRPVALRVQAVAALAALTSLDRGAATKLATLLTSKDPLLRRAVADALPASAAQVLGRLLAEDGAVEVALAAGGALCRDLPPIGADKKAEAALARVAGLSAAARARLRELVKAAELPELDRLDVVPCLRPGAQRTEEARADLEVLRELGRGPDGALKRRARAYGGR